MTNAIEFSEKENQTMPPDNPDKFFEMVPTEFGPRFIARPETIAGVWPHDRGVAEGMMRTRAVVKTLDAFPGASPSPSKKPAFAKPKTRTPTMDDPLPDESDLPSGRDDRVIAELPPLLDGVRYALEPQPDGGWAVVVEPGDPDGMSPLTGDGRRDPRLIKANRDAARFWRDRSGNTRDEQRSTLFVHYPKPGTRLVLEGPNDVGGYALVLVGPDPEDLNANTPLGASGSGVTLRSPGATPPDGSRAGDHLWYGSAARRRDAAKLKMMNQAGRRLWDNRGRPR